MKVLGLSTSSPQSSVAVLDGDRLLAELAYHGEMDHAERLLGMVERALGEARLERRQIDALACDVGPGSFTGTRAGLAAAKGIALVLDRPLVGVGALHAMAAAARACATAEPEPATLICLLDAKRRETFAAVYGPALELRRGPESLPTAGLTVALAETLDRADAFVVGRQGERLEPPPARWLRHPSSDLPHAQWIARLALPLLAAGQAPALEGVQPVYVRPPDATPAAAPR